jgi:hypothetical protein
MEKGAGRRKSRLLFLFDSGSNLRTTSLIIPIAVATLEFTVAPLSHQGPNLARKLVEKAGPFLFAIVK